MEDWKSIDPRRPSGRGIPSRRGRLPRWIGAILIAAVYFGYRTYEPSAESTPSEASSPFSWHEITPSKYLNYHDCGDGFQCARLEVPMDYSRSDKQNRKFALAIVRLPAKVPIEDPRYGGAVLINPGKSLSTSVRLLTEMSRWPWWPWNFTGVSVGSQSSEDRRCRK